MTIAARRLDNQGISEPRFTHPQDVVAWLGAVQAQDYLGAKWALGLRLQRATDDDVDRAFAQGTILRTHVLRPTWHFVTPADIRWMLALTAPRVHQVNARRYRELELDDAVFRQSHNALARALRGGRHLTRDELAQVLNDAGIPVDDRQRLGYLMMHAELDALICSGPRRGKQFTYALLDERVPQSTVLDRHEALAELARRFFSSHGPATVHDFAKWSGLTVAVAHTGLEAVRGELESEVIGDRTLWFSESPPPPPKVSPRAHLLSVFDEYYIGYHDRGDVIQPEFAGRFTAFNAALQYIVIVDGQVVGTWRRTFRRDIVLVHVDLVVQLAKDQHQAIAAAARRYGDFVGLPVTLV